MRTSLGNPARCAHPTTPGSRFRLPRLPRLPSLPRVPRLRAGFLVGAVFLVAAAAGVAGAAESLWLVRCADRGVLAGLAERGVVVSRIEGGAAFVFHGGPDAGVLAESGCAPLLLDAESALSDHFLLFTENGRGLDAVRWPVRLLYRGDGIAVVATPPGGAELAADLGLEMAMLFRTPMRLAPRAAPDAISHKPAAPQQPALVPAESLVAWVEVESLDAIVTALQQMGTRRGTKPGGQEAAQWIAAKFRSYGIDDVVIEPWTAGIAGNVIATIRGRTSPDHFYVVGGHYDSYVADSDYEPGADDNASGTAAVLECARVCASYPFANTVRFIAFGGEELGLLGSEAYAASAGGSTGEWLDGMINLDMIGYRGPSSARDLDVISDIPSQWMLDATMAAAARFVPDLPVKRGKLVSGSSDHASFWRHYYPAIFFHEDSKESSPYIHTVNDIVGTSYNDSALALLTTRVLVATVLVLAGGPQVPVALESFEARPVEEGVLLQWSLAGELRGSTAGIDVQRAEAAPGPFERLTREPLAAGGTTYLDASAPRGRTSWYRLEIRGRDGLTTFGPVVSVTPEAGDDRSRLLPVAWSGARDAALVRYRIGSGAGSVRLAIHDVRGRLVRTLFAGRGEPGEHLDVWDGTASAGGRVASGVYFVILQASDAHEARRLVWIHP